MTIAYFLIYCIFLSIYIIKGISQLKSDFSNNIIDISKKTEFNKIMDIKEKSSIKDTKEKKSKDIEDINSAELMKSDKKNDILNVNSKYFFNQNK